MLSNHTVTCLYCGKGAHGHRRDNQECKAFERAAPANKPFVYMVAREQPAAKGWAVR